MHDESFLRKQLTTYLATPEGRQLRKQQHCNLSSAPGLMTLLKQTAQPSRLLEMVLDECHGRLRKQLGMFFTPSRVAVQMVNEALDLWSRQHCSYDELCNIRILDPACGAGDFLLAALDALLARHQQFQSPIPTDKLIVSIIENNLFGIDCDKNVLELLRERLKLFAGSRVNTGNFVNLDTLDYPHGGMCFPDRKKFDIVIGNPPYVSYGLRNAGKLDLSRSRELRERFPDSAEYKLTESATQSF